MISIRFLPPKVEFSEVFAIVHVTEVIDIRGPADAVDHSFIRDFQDALEQLALDLGEDEPEDPPNIKGGEDH